MAQLSFEEQCEKISEILKKDTELLKSLPPEEAKQKAHADLVRIGMINEDGTLAEPYARLAERSIEEHNQDPIAIAKKRDQIIFRDGFNEKAYGNAKLRFFEDLRSRELRMLMEDRIFDTYPWPKYMEFVWFMLNFNDDLMYLHGFVYHPDRKDFLQLERQSGIIIEGIGRDENFADKKEEKTFKFLFHDADQLSLDPPYCLYK